MLRVTRALLIRSLGVEPNRDECTTKPGSMTPCHLVSWNNAKENTGLAISLHGKTPRVRAALCARVCIRGILDATGLALASSAVLADDSLDWSIRATAQVK